MKRKLGTIVLFVLLILTVVALQEIGVPAAASGATAGSLSTHAAK